VFGAETEEASMWTFSGSLAGGLPLPGLRT
jgi:hypothetical protein